MSKFLRLVHHESYCDMYCTSKSSLQIVLAYLSEAAESVVQV